MKLKVSKCFVFVDLFFVDASRWEQGAIWGSVGRALHIVARAIEFQICAGQLWPASIYLGLF